nr:MAG TPA: hypothetical protein [Caudoviricetes sp.]
MFTKIKKLPWPDKRAMPNSKYLYCIIRKNL